MSIVVELRMTEVNLPRFECGLRLRREHCRERMLQGLIYKLLSIFSLRNPQRTLPTKSILEGQTISNLAMFSRPQLSFLFLLSDVRLLARGLWYTKRSTGGNILRAKNQIKNPSMTRSLL